MKNKDREEIKSGYHKISTIPKHLNRFLTIKKFAEESELIKITIKNESTVTLF